MAPLCGLTQPRGVWLRCHGMLRLARISLKGPFTFGTLESLPSPLLIVSGKFDVMAHFPRAPVGSSA
jgi:hypothetical protein